LGIDWKKLEKRVGLFFFNNPSGRMLGVVAGSSDHLEPPSKFRAHGLLKLYWQLLPYRINPIVDRFINALAVWFSVASISFLFRWSSVIEATITSRNTIKIRSAATPVITATTK
jgi:hypothetical protein